MRVKTSGRRSPARALRCAAMTGLLLLIVAVPGTGARAATCPQHRSGSWFGSYSTTNFSGAAPLWVDLTFTGNSMTGTLYLTSDHTNGTPLSATVTCSSLTLGIVAGYTFEGSITPDGTAMQGTWSYSGGSPAGTWSIGLATETFSTTGTTLTTDTGATGATATDPTQATVVSPTPGDLVIDHASAPSATLAGFQLLNEIIHIEAPSATTTDPLVLTFELDASLLHGAARERRGSGA